MVFKMTCKQISLMVKLRSCIEEIGCLCGENSSCHLNIREFANELGWYLDNRVKELTGNENEYNKTSQKS